MTNPKSLQNRFTLIEMLIVISIIAILASLLMPLMQNSIEMGYQIKCSGNCRQVSLMLNMYMDEYSGFQPKPYLKISESPSQRHLWYQALNPYLDLPIPTSGNTASDPVFMCDILPEQAGCRRGIGDYSLCEYKGWNIYNDWVKPLSLARSPSQTVQFFDGAPYKTWSWSGRDYYDCFLMGKFLPNLTEDKKAVDWRHGAKLFGPVYSYRKAYDGSSNFAFLDGHVETIGNTISSERAIKMHTLK